MVAAVGPNMIALRRALGLVAILFACNGGADAPTTDAQPDDVVDAGPDDGGPSPFDELDGPAVDFSGGVALSPAGVGRDGGEIELRSAAPVTIAAASAVSPLSPSPSPAPPSGGVRVDATAVSDNLVMTETIRIGGRLPATTGPPREIVSVEGDIVVDRPLASAGRGLVLRAPNGIVYVAAPIDASAEEGCNAAPIVIEAETVVIDDEVVSSGQAADDQLGCPGASIAIVATNGPVALTGGRIDSSGGPGAGKAGSAGDITISAATDIDLGGSVDALGGEARGPGAIGGRGGNVNLSGTGVSIAGTLRLRGGGARDSEVEATGGDAGALVIDATGAVQVGGVVDGRGGSAVADGGAVSAGAAGTLRIGANTWPPGITIAAPITSAGGAGGAAGGAGGTLTITNDGDLTVETTVALDGGASSSSPGSAGRFVATVGPNSGGFIVGGTIAAIGGAAEGVSTGGIGGELRVDIISLTGPLILEESARLIADGGPGTNGGSGGAAGGVDLRSRDGDASVFGHVIARGGDAEATGGAGGSLFLWTDSNFDGIGGHLAIETTGLIDVSGGGGAVGGSARNNGAPGVAVFPDFIDQIAVLLDSDTATGALTDGTLVNRGLIVARGGAGGGSGGDVMFHGRQPGSNADPVSGNVDLAGSDGGADGDWGTD
jgi:hypothetical protein